MDIYAANILDHYKNPRNFGQLENPTVRHEEANLSCGDDLTLDLLIENDEIKDLKFSGNGCAVSQAAISILSEELIGMSIAEAENLTKDDVLEMLGIEVSQRRIKCALLCLLTLKNALAKHQGKAAVKWGEIAR